jgi:hypothetical protein
MYLERTKVEKLKYEIYVIFPTTTFFIYHTADPTQEKGNNKNNHFIIKPHALVIFVMDNEKMFNMQLAIQKLEVGSHDM